jgi:pilus assembly protein CpaB
VKGIGGKGVLSLSLVLGVATSYMVYNYVDQASQAAKPIETVPVVTAAKDIPARTTITAEMLRVTQVPLDLKLAQAVATPSDVTGKVSKLPISQGEEVLASKVFGDREQSGLAFVVPAGKRAVAVSVNEVVGSGGMIVPGDDVDVVAVLDTATTTSMGDTKDAKFGVDLSTHAQIKSISQYILQDVEVLAIAQVLEGEAPPPSTTQKAAQAVGTGNSSPQPAAQQAITQPNARTATLAVGPEEAEKLILAEAKGQIRLVLRAHGDTGTVKLDEGLFGDLNGAAVLKSDTKPL